MFEPVCRKNQIIVNNNADKPHIACLSLWTPRSKVAEQYGSKYVAIGQLYSRQRGIVPLFINLLANPQITELHIRGADLGGIIPFLKDLWVNDVTERDGKVFTNTEPESFEIKGISRHQIISILATTNLVITNKKDMDNLEFISHITFNRNITREKIILQEPIPEVKAIPGEDVVVVRGQIVFDVWVKLMDQILRFGHKSGTHYDLDQLEIKNITTVISDEDPHKLIFHKDFPFTEKYFIVEYAPTLLRSIRTDTTYNYGHRMMSYFGINQIQLAVDKLIQQRDARSVVINLWDPKHDSKGKGSPCLNHIWFRIQNDHLTMIATIRSNDMFAGYPENALALRMLQEKVRLDISEEDPVALGNLIIHSQSAHLYSDTFDDAKDIVDRNINKIINKDLCEYDIRGAFEIVDLGDKIEVRHISPTGDEIGLYKMDIDTLEEFVLQSITDTKHIMYLSGEITKLIICRRIGVQYQQGMALWKEINER